MATRKKHRKVPTPKRGGGTIKDFFKRKINGYKKWAVNKSYKKYNKNFINNYLPPILKNELVKKNINSPEFSKVILEKMKNHKKFQDAINDKTFIEIINNLIIIKNWGEFDEFFKKQNIKDNVDEITDLESYNLVVILFSDKYKNTNSFLVKPIQEAYREFYGGE